MSRDKRDAEHAARRAKRLAERAEERARRKEQHAELAAERAERLAERARRRPARDRDQSIEDLVDEVTEKAEAWIDEQTRRLFEGESNEKEVRRAESKAERARKAAADARQRASRAERAAEDLSAVEASLMMEDMGEYDDFDLHQSVEDDSGLDERDFDHMSKRERRKARREARRRAKARGYRDRGWYRFYWGDDGGLTRASRRRSRSAHLYRDRQKKKICGVCAGLGAYFGRPAWEMRLYAVLGVVFVPSVAIPAYFLAYFLMDDKPYYRRVTDRFSESMDSKERQRNDVGRSEADQRDNVEMNEDKASRTQMNNVQAMKVAKDKFSDIEQKLRNMESHVTSSRFELQRELKKISGED